MGILVSRVSNQPLAIPQSGKDMAMRSLVTLAIAAAAMMVLSGCETDATEAASGQYPTVRCPIYEGNPGCGAAIAPDQAAASGAPVQAR
jgi:hypothetical protein